MKKPILINMYGVAGAGKSICATHLTNLLKLNGVNAEYCREVVKEFTVFGGKPSSLSQIAITTDQISLVEAYLRSGADVVVTDSPALLGRMYGIHYGQWDGELEAIAMGHLEDDRFEQVNFLVGLGDEDKFQSFGREQTYEQSRDMQSALIHMITPKLNYTKIEVKSFMAQAQTYVNQIKKLLENRDE